MASKHKVKAGKLLNPMVQQLKSDLGESSGSSSGSPAKSSAPSDCCGGSSGRRSASPERVHTRQPRSFKGSFSSDNIDAGQHADGTTNLTCQGTQPSLASAAPSPPSPRVQTNNSNNKKRCFREDLRKLADDRAKEAAAAHRRPPSLSQTKPQRRLHDLRGKVESSPAAAVPEVLGNPRAPFQLSPLSPASPTTAPAQTPPGLANPEAAVRRQRVRTASPQRPLGAERKVSSAKAKTCMLLVQCAPFYLWLSTFHFNRAHFQHSIGSPKAVALVSETKWYSR
uniref:Uncharacterized protein n=1 Tax=Hippocampus comes TaxID=109280 RepID=A0A3Q2YN05_HIPCM